jgi:hypothetical protein
MIKMETRKTLRSILLFAVLTAVLVASLSLVTFATHSSYTATKVSTTLTIDGNLNETIWADNYNTATYQARSFQYKFAWDDTNLYIAVKALDTNLFCNTSKVFKGEVGAAGTALYPWDYDGVALYFSPTNSQLADHYAPGDLQYMFTYQDDGVPAIRICNEGNPVALTSGDIQAACTHNTTGWNLEVSITLAKLAITDITGTFGFGIELDNADPTTAPDGSFIIFPSNAGWNTFLDADTLTFDQATSGSSSSSTISSSSTVSSSVASSSSDVSSTSATSSASSDVLTTSDANTSSASSDVLTTSDANTSSTNGSNPTTGDESILVIALIGIVSLAFVYLLKIKIK